MKFAEERSRSSIIHVSPFNSEKKRAGVAVVAVIASAFVFHFVFIVCLNSCLLLDYSCFLVSYLLK
jgi:hypothetical protein